MQFSTIFALFIMIGFVITGTVTGCTTTGNRMGAASPTGISEQSMTLIRLGDSMREAGDIPAALSFYQKAVDASPTNEDVMVIYARHMMAYDLPGSDDMLADAVKTMPTARLYNWYGVSLDLNGSHTEAQAAYMRGLEIEPTVSLRNNLALSYAVTKNYNPAVTLFDYIISNDGTNILYHKNRAITKILAGNIDTARADLQTIMHPTDVDELIQLYAGKADTENSITLLKMINGM